MAVDAYLKWQPAFAAHYVGYLQNAMKGQPLWLASWFNFWLRLVIQHTGFFVLGTRLIETAIAIGLLLGFARRITYIAGALFSLLIWSTAEGFGGLTPPGATNLGPALVYALIFVALALFERILGSTPYSLTIISAAASRDGDRWSNGHLDRFGNGHRRRWIWTINLRPSEPL
jgi:nitrite reductase (NO-forming)